jgi:cytochrome P450
VGTAYGEIDSDWGVDHFHPWDSRITYENIWPIYEKMRQRGGITYSDAVGGFWSLSKFQDVRDAARDHELFSSANGTSIGNRDGDSPSPPNAPIDFDPPLKRGIAKLCRSRFFPTK